MRQFILVLSGVMVISSLSACADMHSPRPQLVGEPDAVDLRLADAADRSTRALETLAAVEQSRVPNVGAAYMPNVPPELKKAVTFNWSGPAEPLLQSLAGKIGYNFNTVGARPVTPLVVTMSAQNKPVAEVLRYIGLQLGTRGDLRLDADRRTVEIAYPALANPTGG